MTDLVLRCCVWNIVQNKTLIMKRSFIFLWIFLSISFSCSFAENGNLSIRTPNPAQVLCVSPNARWACGIDLGTPLRGFLWNLETGEYTVLSPLSEESRAFGVSNDGIVAGSFMNPYLTDNGAKILSAGYYKDGIWYVLEPIPNVNMNRYDAGGDAMAISSDGKFIVGTMQNEAGTYKPVLWENGLLKKIYPTPNNADGKALSVSDDGKVVTGWAVDRNRTGFIWTNDSLRTSSSVGYYYEVTKVSPNGKYAIGVDNLGAFIWEVEKAKRINITPYDEDPDQTQPLYVSNDGRIAGSEKHFEALGDAIPYGFIGDKEGQIKPLEVYLEENNINIEEQTEEIANIIELFGMNENQKILVSNAYLYPDSYGIQNLVGFCIFLDVEVTSRPPIQLKAEQLSGVSALRLSWKAPITNVGNILGYNVYRDGIKINTSFIANPFYCDTNTVVGKTYTYTVSAYYNGGTESEPSEAIVSEIKADRILPASNLEGRAYGINDILLKWTEPLQNDAILRWYSGYAANFLQTDDLKPYYFATRYGAEIMNNYSADFLLKQVELVLGSGVKKLEISIRTSTETLFTQEVDVQTLRKEAASIITLTKPLALPRLAPNDYILLVAKISQTKTGYPMGVDEGPAVVGYGDLFSMDGDEFVSAYELNEGALSVNWAMSLLLDKSTEDKSTTTPLTYNIYRNAEKINGYPVSGSSYLDGNLSFSDSTYTYTVETVVDKIASKHSNNAIVRLSSVNKEACVPPQNLKARMEDNIVNLSWSSSETKVDISYSNFNKNMPISIASGGTYYVGIKFSPSRLKLYEGYVYDAFNFFPVGAADFELNLYEDGELIHTQAIQDYQVNKLNTVKLEYQNQLNINAELFLVLKCSNITSGRAMAIDNNVPLAWESDLISTDGINYSSLIAASSSYGNWMMGLSLRPEERTKTIANSSTNFAYNVYWNNTKINTDPIYATVYDVNLRDVASSNTAKVYVSALYETCGEKASDTLDLVLNVDTEDESESPEIVIYPNPASTYINIESTHTPSSVRLYDVSSKEILHVENAKTLDVSSLKNGIYIVKANVRKKIINKKIQIIR